MPTSENSVVSKYAKEVINGSFRSVLTSSHAQTLFTLRPSWSIDQQLETWFDWSYVFDGLTSEEGELLRLIFAIACLHSFIQANWTGPDLDVKPLDVLVFPPPNSDPPPDEVLNQKAISELAYGGEPAYHLARVPVFLRIADLLLSTCTYEQCASAVWWRLRTWLVREQVLDEPVTLPSDVLSTLIDGGGIASREFEAEGRILLEQGLLDHTLSNDRSAADHFVKAARATGLRYELTGVLGRRTKFQQTDLTQLVLLAESQTTIDEAEGNENSVVLKQQESVLPETLALNDDTLLEKTEFTSSSKTSDSRLSHLDANSQPPLHPLDQCILLALCLNVKNTSPSHGLTTEQMMPYVSRVISHPLNWSVHTIALLLRSRLESNRTRTVERSTLQLQALIEQMPTADSTISERLLYFHDIALPSKWVMEKELALRYMSIGVIKSALEVFERLEMWEEVVKCWQAMERRDRGIAIVRDLLEGRKAEADTVISRGKTSVTDGERRKVLFDASREAKLWCLLGDLEPDHALEHYTHAWEVSNHASGRAIRSSGGYHFARGNFKQAIECLKRAVTINPLLSRSWFILGCAYVREEDWEGARDAFIRCVSIDDEDGESWNNLATVYLRMAEDARQEAPVGDESQKSVPFSNRMLAFRALQQGVKHAYENWRMWTNYMIVCMDVGELAEACRALTRIVELQSTKVGASCVDEDVLDKLVDAVTRAPADPEEAADPSDPGEKIAPSPNEGHGLLKRVTNLMERTILPRVSSPRIYRARARLLTWQSNWEEAVNANLDAYRTGIAGSMEKGETDVDRWREGLREVEEIVDVLRNFGPKIVGFSWLLQAKSIVRTFIGKTKGNFEDEPEWERLTDMAEELKQ